MRKLIYGINISLDGCCDHTKMTGDPEIHDYFTEMIRNADTLLYGRKTYELMVPFWPDMAQSRSAPQKSMNDFAQAFDSVRQIVVFSRTLDGVAGKNTLLLRGNLPDEIRKLKQEEGRDILAGGVDLPAQLIELGLVDEYRIVVQPTIVGGGRRLLEGITLQENLSLKWMDAKTLKGGHMALRYAKEPA